MDNRKLHRLATNPKALMDFYTTGRLPEIEIEIPASPLITLLQSLYPRERLRVTAVTISLNLGYTGSRSFRNAQHALNWLIPAGSPTNIPSQSWKDKRFRTHLTLDDLTQHATVPDDVAEAWWRRHPHLRRPLP